MTAKKAATKSKARAPAAKKPAAAPAAKKTKPRAPAAKKPAAAPAAKKAKSESAPHSGVKFTRLQTKLMVMDHLMEEGIIPGFELKVVEKATGKKLYDRGNWVMPEGDFWGMQPEVRDWFWSYPIKPEWLADIESLLWVAGSETMNNVAPNWDGEDALFDVTAEDAADLALMPNLKIVKALFDPKRAKEIVAAFAKHGVTLKAAFD